MCWPQAAAHASGWGSLLVLRASRPPSFWPLTNSAGLFLSWGDRPHHFPFSCADPAEQTKMCILCQRLADARGRWWAVAVDKV